MLRHTVFRKEKVAVRFETNERGVFLRFAPPQGRRFDWQKSISFALSPDECGGIIRVLRTGKGEFRAYHQPPDRPESDAKVLSLRVDNSDRSKPPRFFLSLSFPNRKGRGDGFILSLSEGDGEVIRLFLEESLKILFSTRRQRRRDDPSEDINLTPHNQDEDENPF